MTHPRPLWPHPDTLSDDQLAVAMDHHAAMVERMADAADRASDPAVQEIHTRRWRELDAARRRRPGFAFAGRMAA